MNGIIKKTKALALLSIIIATTVFGAVIFSVSATEDDITQEESVFSVERLPTKLLDELTEEQKEILKAMIEENQADIKENREEIKSQLEEWGIEIPPPSEHPRSFLEDLTEEQRQELKTIRQEFNEAVKNKLEGWGIEVPEFDCMRFARRGPGKLGMVKP